MRTSSSPGVEKGWRGGRMTLVSRDPIDTLPVVDDRSHAIVLERP